MLLRIRGGASHNRRQAVLNIGKQARNARNAVELFVERNLVDDGRLLKRIAFGVANKVAAVDKPARVEFVCKKNIDFQVWRNSNKVVRAVVLVPRAKEKHALPNTHAGISVVLYQDKRSRLWRQFLPKNQIAPF